MDAMAGGGVAGFLDLRQKPTPPPEGFQEAIEELEKSLEAPNPALEKSAETPEALEDKPMEGLEEKSEGYEPSIAAEPPADAPVAPADPDSDLSASSTSMARMKLELREKRNGSFTQQVSLRGESKKEKLRGCRG
jgi:hypothetical protein